MKIALLIFSLLFSHAQASEFFEPHPLNQSEGRNCTVAVCCVFQNEKEWLQEWIEFHKLIGVDHFYLYNNFSTDHYLDVLTPYLLSGEVELFEYPQKPFRVIDQAIIYNHALELSQGNSKWLAAIDTDEFIVPLETKHLVPYLDSFSENIGAIEVNWVTFGTSRVKKLKPGELLIERLIMRAPIQALVNVWHKTLARCEAITGWESPHSCLLKEGFEKIRVTPCNQKGIPEDETSVSKIRIHHYIWRTEDFFYKVKIPRIAKWDVNLFHCSSPIDYLPITNSVLDTTMFDFVPRLKEILLNPSAHPMHVE